jgi:hypothetical protein
MKGSRAGFTPSRTPAMAYADAAATCPGQVGAQREIATDWLAAYARRALLKRSAAVTRRGLARDRRGRVGFDLVCTHLNTNVAGRRSRAWPAESAPVLATQSRTDP